MARARSEIRMTVAEFLRWHDVTDTRHELVGGHIVAMAPPSGRHVVLAFNVTQALQPQLPRPCRALQGGGVARTVDDSQCRIPDVLVSCEATPGAVFIEPRLIVEVLSPSTEKEDRTAKLDFYKSLPSVEAILFVWQDERRVQLHTRETPRWPAQDFIGGGSVPLVGLGAELALDAIYAGVELPAKAGEDEAGPAPA